MEFARLDPAHRDPVSRDFDDVYFSQDGGLAETRHVFLAGNDLPRRLSQHSRPWFTIGETGFGTGLNFLAAWQACRDHGSGLRLHFISTERYPIHPDQLPALLAPMLDDLPVGREFLRAWSHLVPGWNRFSFADAELTLWLGDATAGFEDCTASIDAWFLDGFSPARNPDLWQPGLFRALARLSHAQTTLATFTVASLVRTGLTAAGFRVEKRPGFGRKRHCLQGQFIGFHGPLPFAARDYWWPRPQPVPGRSIAIVGASLAAAELAVRCRRRQLEVTVYAPADAAQPFPDSVQGAVYARPGLEADPATCHYAAALSYRLRQWSTEGQHWPGQRTGLLQLMPAERWDRLLNSLSTHPFAQLVQPLAAAEASQRAGVTLTQPALWFRDAGWIAPAAYTRQLLQDCRQISDRVQTLAYSGSGWTVTTADGSRHRHDAVLIAAGACSDQWAQTAHLPLKPVRGQLTAVAGGQGPHCVVCGERYVTPPDSEGQWHFGATFTPGDSNDTPRASDRQDNLDALRSLSGELAQRAAASTASDHAAVRATTPDYLPLAGPVLQADIRNRADPRHCYAPWSALYAPGLFVLTGLGSKGLASAPLLAEYVVCQLTGEPLPFGRQHESRVHAERHWLRNGLSGRRPIVNRSSKSTEHKRNP